MWEGGTKVWTDRAFALETRDGPWRELDDRLLRPLGYGVSLTTSEGLACLGGGNAAGHYSDAFVLSLRGGRLVRSELPALPQPCANMCGALLGRSIYVAGGLAEPAATATLKIFWSLDLSRPPAERKWETLDPWPGPPRMLAVAAALDGTFYLMSGTNLTPAPDGKAKRTYLRDAYSYRPGSGWKRLADLPRPAVAAPSPAAVDARQRILVVSGDDGTKVALPPAAHPGFPTDVLAYDPMADAWTAAGESPAPFVTTPLVPGFNGYVVPGGEIRPGVRTPRMALATPNSAAAEGRSSRPVGAALAFAAVLGLLALFARRTCRQACGPKETAP